MSVPASLEHLAGSWSGRGILIRPWESPPETTYATTAVIRVAAKGFLRLDCTWVDGDTAHEGELLLSADLKSGTITAIWIDSWHMSDSFMVSTGAADEAGAVSVVGSYAAPPGPDWGWRTVIAPLAEGFEIVMDSITPAGEESLAVRNLYDRRT